MAERHDITATPTLPLFRDGKEIARRREVIDRGGLGEFMESVL